MEKLLEEASHRGGGTVSGGKGAEPATIILQIVLTCLFYVSYLSKDTDKYKYQTIKRVNWVFSSMEEGCEARQYHTGAPW